MGIRILAVIETPELTQQIISLLNSAGYRDIITVDQLTTALEYLAKQTESTDSTNQSACDLIVAELSASFDGLEICRRVAADQRLADIPVVIIADSLAPELLLNIIESGATDFIAKPINELIVEFRVRLALKLKAEREKRKFREEQLNQISNLLEETSRKLLHLSTIDGLTGIANRKRFDDAIEREWRRAVRNAKPLALIMIDVDYFKAYNDFYGHVEGDRCLKQVAGAINSPLRRGGDLAARYGGEEFAVILPETTAEGAVIVAENIRDSVAGLELAHCKSLVNERVTVSIGVGVTIPTREATTAQFIEVADSALYRAKQSGRNRVMVTDLVKKTDDQTDDQ